MTLKEMEETARKEVKLPMMLTTEEMEMMTKIIRAVYRNRDYYSLPLGLSGLDTSKLRLLMLYIEGCYARAEESIGHAKDIMRYTER